MIGSRLQPDASEGTPRADVLELVTRALRDRSADNLERTIAAVSAHPDAAAAVSALRGEALRRRGEHAEAIALLERSIAAAPGLHAAYHCAALAHAASGSPERARAVWLVLLQRQPDDPLARYQIGLTWHDEGRLEEAIHWYEAQIAHQERSFQAWYNLGLAALDLGRAHRAAEAFLFAVSLDPQHYRAWMALGGARRAAGDRMGAIEAWMRAAALPTTTASPLALAAAAHAEAAELPTAIALLERAVALEPRNASLRWAAGSHLSHLGAHREAVQDFREALRLDPADWRGHSRLLLELQYDTRLASRAELAAAHREWGRMHVTGVPRVAASGASHRTDSRLRIGYLSPRFGVGPLANFFLPVLARHDRRCVHVTLYSAWAHDDAVTAQMRAACDAWRALPDDDDAAAAMIAADGLDLLVDLAGHAPGHRLHVLARKPAPVQATWLDYFDTTGVEAIDYVVSDDIHTPPAEAAHFAERLVLLPGCRFVYAPLFAPSASPPPCLANGLVTFGSFNRHAKITEEVRALWKAILERVPGSRLQLRASAYRGEDTVAWLREHWARAGMPVDRIDFRPYVPIAEAMRAYEEIDIALDTSPYNGGATTCDALAMGVPVVTLLGDRMIARQSAALLAAARRREWIATSAEEYVDIAAGLAHGERLRDLRPALRQGLPATSLCDVGAFVAALERTWDTLVAMGPRQDSSAPPIRPIEAAR